jgi:hypothetical protein
MHQPRCGLGTENARGALNSTSEPFRV